MPGNAEIATLAAATAEPSATRTYAGLAPLACAIAALACWGISLPQIDPAGLDDFGLISILPWTMGLGYGLIVLGFCLTLAQPRPRGWLALLLLASLVLMLHGTPAFAYQTLRYSWAWKHLGIVDFILRHGALDPDARFLAVYHNWPGFFLASAALAQVLGRRAIELVDIARFFPLGLNLLYLAILPPIFRRLTDDPRLVWTAAALFVLGNWVGQDYFSPQGTSYLLYLAVLALCLGPLARQPGSADPADPALVRHWKTARAWLSHGLPAAPERAGGLVQVVAAIAAMVAILAITATHQFTPMVLISGLFGLALLGRLGFGYCLFAIAAEIGWLFYFADAYIAATFADIVAEFGNTADTAFSKMVDLAKVSPGQVWVSTAARALTGAIAALAGLGGLRRLFAGYRDGPAAILAFAAAPLLAATSYGGEITFRVYFFGLPFLAFFAAALLFPTTKTRRWPLLVLGPLLAVLILGFILANNGKDRQYRFTPAEVEAATWLYANAPPGSLLIEGARNYPSQFMNYEYFAYVPISEEHGDEQRKILDDPAGVLGRWLDEADGGFVIFTRSQKAAIDDLGQMPAGAIEGIEAALLASPQFVLVHATADARIFARYPAAAGGVLAK